MARQWFPTLRGALETKGLAERTRSQATRYSVSGVPYQNNWSVDRAVTEGFQTNPWVFRAVEVITYAGLIRKIVLRVDDPDTGKVVPITQDPTRLLFCLNRRANPWETAKMFRYRLIAQFLLSSKGVYIEVARSRAGRYAMLTLLDPDLVDIVPSPTNPISAFQIRTTGDTGGKIDTLPPFDPEKTDQPNSVLWVRSPHPTLLPAAMSPMQAAGLSVDLDRYARLYNRDYMQSNGRPGGILAVKGTVDEETVKALEARFNHQARPGEVTAIQADAMDYKDLSSTPRDLQWGDVMDRMRKEASMVFGVPESMMGDASGRCVDDQTEALTQRGWLHGDRITTEDTILSMDPADGQLKWSPVHEVYRAHYHGPMYRLRHSHADFLVTPGHNWAVEPRYPSTGGHRYLLRKVEDLSTHDRIRTIGDAEAGADESTYSSAFVELVGWAVTEGAFHPSTRSREMRPGNVAPYVRIRQNVGPLADRIAACAKESGAHFIIREADGRALISVRGEVAAALHQVAPEKIMTTAFLLALTADQRRLLMHTMLDADGCTSVPNTSSWTFAQKDRRATEAFIFLATLCGYTTSLREREFTYRYKGVERPARDWIAIVRQRKVMTIQRQTRTSEPYDGPVWCPRTDYGTFVARRHGKVLLTGNTFANADAEYAVFMEHRFAPLLALLDDQLDVLTGGYADDLWLRHDLTDVWVLARHRRAQEDRAAADQAAGLCTIDDVRDVKGMPRLNVPGSRVLWIPAGRIAVADAEHTEDAEDAAAAPQGGMGQPADPAVEAAAGAERGAAIGAYNAQTNAAASRLRVVGGTNGAPSALEQRHGRPAELTTADPPLKESELEGKQRGAREPGDRWRTGSPAPIWR